MPYITANGHLQCTGQGLEDALNLVVFVIALSFDVEIHLGAVAQALEEMQEHLRWHLANLLALEFGIPHQPGSSAKVETHGAGIHPVPGQCLQWCGARPHASRPPYEW